MKASAAIDDRQVRVALAAVAALAVVVSLGYLASVPAATATWPFTVTRITHLLIAAIGLAFAAPTLWVAWTGDIAALAGIGATIAAAFVGFGLVSVSLLPSTPGMLPYIALAAVGALLGFATFAASRRRAEVDGRPTPRHIRALFVVLAVTLVLTGGAMVLRVPDVLPWSVDLASQQLVGALFLGDAAYFLYAAARPVWPHAAGALIAFLTYDVVLLAPLVGHASVARPEHRLGLTLYLAVVGLTALVALYQLFLDRRTRLAVPALATRATR